MEDASFGLGTGRARTTHRLEHHSAEPQAMDMTPWNPWKELEKVQLEVENLLSAALGKIRSAVGGKPLAFVPVTDVIETTEDYRFYLSLPGMLEEDIDVSLDGTVLQIRGERSELYDSTKVIPHLRQWKYGYFERRIQLSEPVDADAIEASYDAGVLTIRIQKSGISEKGEKA
jgi:HSP20 family protein